jgi:hypothetical protein
LILYRYFVEAVLQTKERFTAHTDAVVRILEILPIKRCAGNIEARIDVRETRLLDGGKGVKEDSVTQEAPVPCFGTFPVVFYPKL